MTNLFTNRLSLILGFCAVLFMFSCGDDNPIIDPGDGLNLADGQYLMKGTDDPVSSAGLVAEQVEANDFKSQDRTGFSAGYMYLEAGDYTLVTVSNKEVTGSIGGTATASGEGLGSDCGHDEYTLVSTSADGPAFNVGAGGLYKVTYDAMTNEMLLYNIKDASIIGSATDAGWSGDTPLDGTVSSTGASWTKAGIILRSGMWKVRFNCNWGINRRIDPNGSLDDPANGYQPFTNFGGSIGDLVTGGSNLDQTDDGEYTVTVAWTPQNGFSLTAERTGDAPVITFNPNDFQMGIIGDATANGWDADRNLFHKEEGGVHTWYGVVTFVDSGSWKFRANDEWNFDLGGETMNLSAGGDNLASPGAGGYYITLSTPDEGDSWSATVSDADWGVIGDGSPQGNWDADLDMESKGFDMGISSYEISGDFTSDGWKFRAGNDWKLNLGGMLTFLEVDGDNISLAAPGNYTVTLSYNGEVFSATVQ